MWRFLVRRARRRITAVASARDLNDELQFHLDMEIEHNVRTGLSPAAARAKARRELGAVGEWAGRDPSAGPPPRTPWLETLARDVRLAVRSLRRSPGFSLVAILTIALGVGVTTAVYSTIDGVLLRPLPFPAPDRLVRIYERSQRNERGRFTGANIADIQRETKTLAGVAGASPYETAVLGANEPLRTRVAGVSREFFAVFGVPALRGRHFGAGEGLPNGAQAAIVSERFWRTSLGGDPRLEGRVLRLDDASYPVVGVMPASFNLPSRVDVWFTNPDENPSRSAHNWSLVVGRLAPGRSVADARMETDNLLRRLKAQYGKEMDAEGTTVVGLHDDLASTSRTTLLILLGAVGFVLLVACVNLASANLARGEGRQREFAVRTALGAGRGRVVRQILTENLILALTGGLLGAALAWALTRALVVLGDAMLPRWATIQVDGRVLLFALGASVLTGLVVGAAPALQIARDLRGAIVAGGRAGIDGARLRVRGILIGTEVALAVALLAGAGLLAKSLRTVLAEDAGVQTENVMTADIALPTTLYSYKDSLRIGNFYDRAVATIRELPGVRSVGFVSSLPLTGGGPNSGFAVDGGTEMMGSTDYLVVDSAYFKTLGIPVVAGRTFGAADRPGAEHAVVINRAMAKQFWPSANPIGHRIRFPGMDLHKDLWLTVVGVVGDVRSVGLDTPPGPAAFVYFGQRPERIASGATLVVRATSLPDAMGRAIRMRIRAIDPNVPVKVATLASIVDDSVSARRFSTTVLTTFAALALLLAAIGIHGVLAYLVAQRQREIGVRMALGAAQTTVRGMVIWDAMRAVLPGVVVGLAGALALSRVLRGMLYGVSATDPIVFATVAVVLTLVALAAAWLPARRATRIDPLIAIRAD